MIRYNADLQQLADVAAREEDFFCASYYGRVDGPCAFSWVGYEGPTFVYLGRYEDSMERATSMPYLYLLQGEEVISVCSEISFKVIRQVKHRNCFPHGKRLFHQHELCLGDLRLSDNEYYYSSDIVKACE